MGNNVTLIPKQPARHSLLTNVENVVYMPLASEHSHGIVKIGNGLNITSGGLLSIDFTKGWFGQVDNDIVALSNDVDYLKTANRDLSVKINSLTVEMSSVKADISELPNVYQKQNDLTLLTVNKTIVGGINELKTHTQTNSNDISAIELDLSDVKTSYATKTYVNSLYGTVSMGGHKSVVFDTRQEFVDWLDGTFTRTDNLNPSLLNVGDMVLIVEMGVPDYWVKFKNDPMTLADFAEYEAKIEIPEVTYDGISITKNQKGEFQAVALKDGFTKISDQITVSDFDGAVYLPVDSYKELLEYGSISVGDEQVLFDNDTIYVTPYDEDQDIEELDNRVEILENNALMNSDTIIFAESERQKSKNLYNKDAILLKKALRGNDGVIADNDNFFVSNDMFVKGLANIVMSGGISSNDYFIFYDENFVMIGNLHRTGDNIVLDVPSNAVYARFECKIENVNNNIQVESGLVATDYQPYNGQITHNGYKPVVFAESERQKSKNLFNINTNDYYLINSTISREDNIITATSTGAGLARWVLKVENLIVGKTYTLSVDNITKINEGVAKLHIGNTENPDVSEYGFLNSDNLTLTFVATSSILYIKAYVTYDTEIRGTQITNLMLEEGSIATEYQPYNGSIVHEKDIDLKENLFDIDSSINIESAIITTLKEFFDLFNLDKSATYYGAIGEYDNTTLKTLLGNPSGFGVYTRCVIKLEMQGAMPYERRTTYKVLALDSSSKKIAIGYIWKSNDDVVYFTGWTIIGG